MTAHRQQGRAQHQTAMIIKRTQEVGGVDERPDVEVEAGEVGHGVFGWPEVDHVPTRQDHTLVHVVEDRRAGLGVWNTQKERRKRKTRQLRVLLLCVTTLLQWQKGST